MAKNCGSGTGILTTPCFRGNLGSKTLDVGRSRENARSGASQIISTPYVGLSPFFN